MVPKDRTIKPRYRVILLTTVMMVEGIFRLGVFFRVLNCFVNVSRVTGICQIQHLFYYLFPAKQKDPFVALTQTPDKIIMLCSQVG